LHLPLRIISLSSPNLAFDPKAPFFMKKAKIMLIIIAIFGVVGGALALKSARSFGTTGYYCVYTFLNNFFYVNTFNYSTVTENIICPIVGYKTKIASSGFTAYIVGPNVTTQLTVKTTLYLLLSE
jgi:hypothetical protein